MYRILVLFVDHHTARVCDTWEEVHKAVFSPEVGCYRTIPLRTYGRSYQQRKESVIDLASLYMEYGCNMLDIDRTKMWLFFKESGKRYGLTKELYAAGVI